MRREWWGDKDDDDDEDDGNGNDDDDDDNNDHGENWVEGKVVEEIRISLKIATQTWSQPTSFHPPPTLILLFVYFIFSLFPLFSLALNQFSYHPFFWFLFPFPSFPSSLLSLPFPITSHATTTRYHYYGFPLGWNRIEPFYTGQKLGFPPVISNPAIVRFNFLLVELSYNNSLRLFHPLPFLVTFLIRISQVYATSCPNLFPLFGCLLNQSFQPSPSRRLPLSNLSHFPNFILFSEFVSSSFSYLLL